MSNAHTNFNDYTDNSIGCSLIDFLAFLLGMRRDGYFYEDINEY